MDPTALSLIEAQERARALFAEVVAAGLIVPGKLESELSTDIHHLARERFGVRRHWHKRIARAGENTMLTYYDEPEDRRRRRIRGFFEELLTVDGSAHA